MVVTFVVVVVGLVLVRWLLVCISIHQNNLCGIKKIKCVLVGESAVGRCDLFSIVPNVGGVLSQRTLYIYMVRNRPTKCHHLVAYHTTIQHTNERAAARRMGGNSVSVSYGNTCTCSLLKLLLVVGL